MQRIKAVQATTESIFHQRSLKLLHTAPRVKKYHGVVDILLCYLGKYGYHKGNQNRRLGKCNLKCEVSFRSSSFTYVPASRSARLMKSPMKSSQYPSIPVPPVTAGWHSGERPWYMLLLGNCGADIQLWDQVCSKTDCHTSLALYK